MVERPPCNELHEIEDHGIIGDMSTAALVARDGTIDFMCWPRFDSPSIFTRLLDIERGGEFSIRPELPGARNLQLYLPDTNVLLTRWMANEGSAEIVDFMRPIRGEDGGGSQLVRRVMATRGRVEFSLSCRPRFDYGRVVGTVKECEQGVHIDAGEAGLSLRLASTVALQASGGDVLAQFTLEAGEVAWFVLDDGSETALTPEQSQQALDDTTVYWRAWVAKSTYTGRWRETVMRSALALKLLTSRDHGSMVAAATFGLPEALGGVRNWDYRFTWVRDASFTMYAFLRLGFNDEARQFTRWVDERITDTDAEGHLHLVYGIDGSTELEEQSLDHLAGYRDSHPILIGNAAFDQKQLDIYGELMDAVYLSNKYGEAISRDGWVKVCKLVDYVGEHWRDADAGIWEMRDKPKQFLHSRLMCWVAVDRALRLAQKRSLQAPFARWAALRNDIHENIWSDFWNEEKGHFVQSLGSTELDASLLLMPLVRFVSATDPRWLATLDAIGRELGDDGMVMRYRVDDGLPGKEGAFTTCSFWYVECLARAGRLDEARTAFAKVLGYANHLGLYAEELDRDGSHLGNFPQALTHLALISAAYYLDRELGGKGQTLWRP
jgi:GH15 family glucan-1,4-alpha-glucosidase